MHKQPSCQRLRWFGRLLSSREACLTGSALAGVTMGQGLFLSIRQSDLRLPTRHLYWRGAQAAGGATDAECDHPAEPRNPSMQSL